MAVSAGEHAPAAEFGIAPPDDFHYASLYLAPAARGAARVLEAARRAIVEIPPGCSDRGVAHLKLAWWEQELARLAAGEPRHPLTQAMAPLLRRWPDLPRIYARLVANVVTSLSEPRYADDAALHGALRARQDELATLLIGLGAPVDTATRDGLLELAVQLELARALRGLRQHRRGGAPLIAGDALARAGLTLEQVREARLSVTLRDWLAPEMTRVQARLRTQRDALPRATRRGQALFVTLAECALEALALTLADDCRVLEQRVEVLPVRKLWLAWRVRHIG